MSNQTIERPGTYWINDQRQRKSCQQKLLTWYRLNRRDLPWRLNRDPYRVWISEIMLQQTRVAAVIPHYHKFLQLFPTIQKLAAARESSVLAAWSGLGYYRRARMLHAAAKQVVKQHGGNFPRSSEGLSDLPGIGRYTAAAIASIAYGESVGVVDGNVKRLLERLVGRPLADHQTWEFAEQLLSRKHPGDFNQALMELGATVCLPQEPKCQICPVTRQCVTRGHLGKQRIATARIKRTSFYTLSRQNGLLFLVKRSDDAAVMPNMWELPEASKPPRPSGPFIRLRHSITTTDFEVLVYETLAPNITAGKWVGTNRIPKLPLTGLARKILTAAKII